MNVPVPQIKLHTDVRSVDFNELRPADRWLLQAIKAVPLFRGTPVLDPDRSPDPEDRGEGLWFKKGKANRKCSHEALSFQLIEHPTQRDTKGGNIPDSNRLSVGTALGISLCPHRFPSLETMDSPLVKHSGNHSTPLSSYWCPRQSIRVED